MVRVLISEETLELLEELPAEVTCEAWGTMNVKGRQEPLNVFELRSTAT